MLQSPFAKLRVDKRSSLSFSSLEFVHMRFSVVVQLLPGLNSARRDHDIHGLCDHVGGHVVLCQKVLQTHHHHCRFLQKRNPRKTHQRIRRRREACDIYSRLGRCQMPSLKTERLPTLRRLLAHAFIIHYIFSPVYPPIWSC